MTRYAGSGRRAERDTDSPFQQPSVLVLPPIAQSIRQARQFVGGFCAAAGLSNGARDTAVLLTSETVTNAVVHARTDACLRVETVGCGVRVEVRDSSSRMPILLVRLPGDETENGRGLLLLEALADSYGTRAEPSGKVVWFTVLESATRGRSSLPPGDPPRPSPGGSR